VKGITWKKKNQEFFTKNVREKSGPTLISLINVEVGINVEGLQNMPNH
jgi:hypothetical protein